MTDAIIPRSPGTVTLWLLICALGTFLVSIPSALAALSEDHDAARAVFAEAVAAEFGVGSHEVIVQHWRPGPILPLKRHSQRST